MSSDGRACVNAYGFGKKKALPNIIFFAEKFPWIKYFMIME